MPGPVEKLRNLNLRRFSHLNPIPTLDLNLPDERDFHGLAGARGPHLFLQTYSQDALWQRLEETGTLAALHGLGFQDLRLHLSTADPEHQTLRLESLEPPLADVPVEMILRRGQFQTSAPFAKTLHGVTLPMLFIQWICLQNPLQNTFTAERPRLPGQSFPGLGLGTLVMKLMADLARRLDLEAICNSPEFPHNALLYSLRFYYFNPETEGVLQALRRDLAAYCLADISWGILQGCVRDEVRGVPRRGVRVVPRGAALSPEPASCRLRARSPLPRRRDALRLGASVYDG